MTHIAAEQEDAMKFSGDALEAISFDATDRCDRCGSQALALARKTGFADLLFCGHHHRDHSDALIEDSWTVIFDEATWNSYTEPVGV